MSSSSAILVILLTWCVLCPPPLKGQGTVRPLKNDNSFTQKRAPVLGGDQRVRIVSKFPGNDLGAQINSADVDLRASSGEIWVDVAGTISTAVTLSVNHVLRFLAPVTLSNTITLASGDSIYANGLASEWTLSFPEPGDVIVATSQSDLIVDGIYAKSTSSTNAYLLFHVKNCNHVTMRNSHGYQTKGFLSEAMTRNYSGVTDNNSSHDITVINNSFIGTSSTSFAISLTYTRGGIVSGNYVEGFNQGIYFWGGDSNPAVDGALYHERKARDITISHNVLYNSTIWGSMGSSVSVDGNTVDTCPDLCLDSEGSDHVVFMGNAVKDGQNGAIATFYLNRDVIIADNTAISTSPGKPLLSIFNSSQSSESNKDIRIADNHFDCQSAGVCVLTSRMGPAERLVVTGNSFRNVRVELSANNQHYVEVSYNDLVFDHSSAEPFNAIGVEHANSLRGERGFVKIVQNTIDCMVAQPAGSAGIYVLQDDYNSSPITLVVENQIIGSKPFPFDIDVGSASKNPSVRPLFLISNNLLGAGTFAHLDQGDSRSIVKLEGNYRMDFSAFPGGDRIFAK
jgi:hypothetical protein